MALPIPCFQTCRLYNWERMNFCWFKSTSLFVPLCYSNSRKLVWRGCIDLQKGSRPMCMGQRDGIRELCSSMFSFAIQKGGSMVIKNKA